MSRNRRIQTCLGCVLLLLFVEQDSARAEEDLLRAQLQAFNKVFTRIAKEVTPSVATISTRQTVDPEVWESRDPRFRFHPFFRMPRQEPDREGLGSGIIVTEDGYILTNHHVAGGADRIKVILHDNREFQATLVGSDSLTDVAVIKIEERNFRPAKLGDSDKIEIGEWVLAVGAPLGIHLRSTVTSGIVSAIGRNLDIIRDTFGVEDFIQTDAAINPGNSGGPLVNLRGEVIGINTAIATSTGRFEGYGFAIPINLAKKVMDDIAAHGYVRRGYLGVSLREVDASLADAFGLERPKGVLIVDVIDTPARAAGLEPEDILLSIDGQPVDRPNQIQSLIARRHPGDRVSLEVRRSGRTSVIEATLGEREPGSDVAALAPEQPVEESRLGMTVQDITVETATRFGLDADTKGIVVVRVDRGSAREAGFRPGNVIFKVRQGSIEQEIRSVKDFNTAIARLEKGRNAAFSVRRDGNRSFLTMKVPE